jgi:hypothetical protein
MSLLLVLSDVPDVYCTAVSSSVYVVLSAVNLSGGPVWASLLQYIPSSSDVSTGFGIPAFVRSLAVPVVSCAAVGLLLICSYHCCFGPGVYAMARVTVVADFPSDVEVISVTVASNFLGST